MAFLISAAISRLKRKDAQNLKDGRPSGLDERNSLTKKSEPEDTTPRSDIKQEMLPGNSYDIQPSDGDREGLLIKEQHSISERQPRKINEVPGDIRPLVPTQGTEKQPRKKDDVQPLDVTQQRPPPMEDDVQLSDVIHHEEPEATIQSPDGKQEISEPKEEAPDVGDIQRSNIVPGNLPDVMYEQQPRKIDKPLDDNEEELPLVGAHGVQLSEVIHHEEPEATIQTPDGKREISEPKGAAPGVGGMDAKDAEQASREIQKLRRDLSESHSQIAELRNRCEAQSRDLEGSDGFLNTADKSSDSDVIRALQRLNAEVQQHTSYMADCLAEYFEFENVTTNPTQEQISAVQRTSDHIGRILAESLGTNKPEDIPMLLQIALQTYLASALCQTASSWAFEPGYNSFIHGIYQRLRRVGEKLNVRMGPRFQLTRRKMVTRGASCFWTLAFARARPHRSQLEFPPRIPRQRDPHKHF